MKGLALNVDMARAWHAGRKSVTRRLMKPQPKWEEEPGYNKDSRCWCGRYQVEYGHVEVFEAYPQYQPGEVVYIQEPYEAEWFPFDDYRQPMRGCWDVRYQCDNAVWPIEVGRDETDVGLEKELRSWRSPITMPAKFSRSKARILSVRAERVQAITEEEAFDEGIRGGDWLGDPVGEYIDLWDRLHPGSWDRNEFVWVYGLEKVEAESR